MSCLAKRDTTNWADFLIWTLNFWNVSNPTPPFKNSKTQPTLFYSRIRWRMWTFENKMILANVGRKWTVIVFGQKDNLINADWSSPLQQVLSMVTCHRYQILVKFNASWLVHLQPPSTNKILITPELWLQENAQSAADGEKATCTGTKRELSTSETTQGPLDLKIKVR